VREPRRRHARRNAGHLGRLWGPRRLGGGSHARLNVDKDGDALDVRRSPQSEGSKTASGLIFSCRPPAEATTARAVPRDLRAVPSRSSTTQVHHPGRTTSLLPTEWRRTAISSRSKPMRAETGAATKVRRRTCTAENALTLATTCTPASHSRARAPSRRHPPASSYFLREYSRSAAETNAGNGCAGMAGGDLRPLPREALHPRSRAVRWDADWRCLGTEPAGSVSS